MTVQDLVVRVRLFGGIAGEIGSELERVAEGFITISEALLDMATGIDDQIRKEAAGGS